MISFEVFEDVTYEITDTFPEVFFRELNGGVMVREYSRLHPAALDHDLFVLGEYHHCLLYTSDAADERTTV